MKRLLTKLIRGLAYFGAAVVIVLAIAVGIFRLMLPRLPEYQEEIKAWASSAIGMNVEFSGMNARWRLSGPEISFFDAGLSHQETGASVIAAEEVSIGVGLLRLVIDRELVVDRVSIRNSALDIRQDADGNWLLQGMPIDNLVGNREVPPGAVANIAVVGTDIDVAYEHPSSGELVPVTLNTIRVTGDSEEIGVDADIALPARFGDRLEISANRRIGEVIDGGWQFYVEGDGLSIPGWTGLEQSRLPEVTSGDVDFVLWFDLLDGKVDSASAMVSISDLATVTTDAVPAFGIQGDFEYSADPNGWLIGANQLRVLTVDGDWPQSDLQVRVENNSDGALEVLRVTASYFNINDLRYFKSWLPEQRQQQLAEFSPSGVVRNVDVEVSNLDADTPQFSVLADLEESGFVAKGDLPGVQNFSGRVRADRDGGRVEIESTSLELDLGDHLADPLMLDDAFGTVIWRRSQDGVIVLSDSVQVRNADFDSQMSLQVSLPAGDEAPVIDFDSTWAVFDVSAVDRYLPVKLVKPKLYEWLSDALVSGFVRRGSTRFVGALDDFPFDDGSGIFRIDARIEDATLQYAPNWPAPKFRHLDIVVENTRLFSEENSADNLGNFVEDARIEIPDLREPILSIDTFATGSLQSIRDFAQQSPIAAVFGGHLERVDVAGDASFDLSIVLPIQRAQEYEFTTRIRSSDGSIKVQGFDAPITALNGVVIVTRDTISSESLFGQFLGNTIDLSLSRSSDPDSPFAAVLTGNGRTTVEALQTELGLPLGGVVEGDTEYQAKVSFPNNRASEPGVLQVVVESDLYGIQANVPEPLSKSDEMSSSLTMNIDFPSPEVITTSGSLAGELNWTARFVRAEENWDFDRGVLALGEYPRDAGTRGLHIHGQVNSLDLHAWLAEGRRGDRGEGLGQRIRSIDLGVDSLYAIGQQFSNQRIVVNRSGQDWVIQVTGHDVEGLITVPYDFRAGRPMTLEMDRLRLPGTDSSVVAGTTDMPDPRILPALSVTANEFALGERRFGRLEAEFDRDDRGLVSSRLETTDDSFSVSGSAGWVVDAFEASGQRTYIDVALISNNVAQTSERLAYNPGISSDTMSANLNIGWPGPPRRDFMEVMTGEVSVAVGEGTLADVDPGAGRVFGLMSIAALPRRLSLDFSDVFEEGFGFDSITGDFRLENGDAYTCNLTLTGPAADVGIIGRAGLVTRDYDQAAIVAANFGNTLPVVGLLTGGPQVAAALLIFSQIFKKPLQDIGQLFYSVEGSWDEPTVDTIDSQGFAAVSDRAECIAQ